MEKQLADFGSAEQSQCPSVVHTPVIISVQVEPCKDLSGVKICIEMGRLIVWRQVETLSYKIDSVLKGTYMAHAALVHKCQDLVHKVKHTWCFE